jgi:hypothetical protein
MYFSLFPFFFLFYIQNRLYYLFCSTGISTQGLAIATQKIYLMNHAPSIFVLFFR